jgi:hypothetical protein
MESISEQVGKQLIAQLIEQLTQYEDAEMAINIY